MSSLNKVMLIGNAGRDTELRHTANGLAVANVSIATTIVRKDKQTGEKLEDTQWHRVTFYDRLAEIAAEYVRKGTKVYVEGSIKYGKYTDKDGVEKQTTDVVASQLTLLSSRESQGNENEARQQPRSQERSAPQRGGYERAPQRQEEPRHQPQRGGGGSGFDDMDSDIPF